MDSHKEERVASKSVRQWLTAFAVAGASCGAVAGIVGSADPSSNKDVLKHIEQGYVSWLADPKVQFDIGKFVTWNGAEVIESKDNWNYTRSIQFGFAIPFYHTGVRATISPSD